MQNLTNRVAEGCHEQRDTQREQETRVRLLHAALLLLSKKNIERVAIDEVTEATNVGFGSFYSHFKSKEGLSATVIDWAFKDFADKLDTITHGLADPAEVITIAAHHTLLRAQREPAWDRLLTREGVSTRALARGLGLYLLRDSKHGLAAKRFVVADPLTNVFSVIGTVLAGITVELHSTAAPTVPGHGRQTAAAHIEYLAERTAVLVPQALSIKRAEAERITQLPLSEVRNGNAAAAM